MMYLASAQMDTNYLKNAKTINKKEIRHLLDGILKAIPVRAWL